MPGTCGAPVDQPRDVSEKPSSAGLWLAVTFHAAWFSRRLGSVASTAGSVHGFRRLAVAARTRATSAGVTIPPALPNALLVYDATAATHSSVFVPMGNMTSENVSPFIGPTIPFKSTLTT